MILRKLTDWPTWGWRNPFDEIERMRRDMERLAQGLTGTLLREPSAGVFPLMNVTEDNDSYYVRAELPGIKANELDISVTGDSLTILGERKIHSEDEKANYHRMEREGGKFSRVLSLPGQIDTSKVEASAADGVLTVILPKAEAAKPKQITVKA
ncbi:MAG: Hsp20/alpha crystallin family protein [Deltaproteobacteria bacterium]|nr:Hsp20/alpha crystallin family protein [Deltaproteobacteria bacterium]OQY14647.1 MAG: heat-shock protein Hsp20 [Desulfobacterium sp. 4572_20]HDH87796.1 Hsp20/alpha crystallin family protein [Desulfobacteraceae bacterium]MBW2105322.1 Hsp20/alpha crystallin family protein [Deltaproteobacteria bacterium]MBW2333256.1 Hsp20/alpha crystallin family protein [Deltaproteobacteria bacterium]